MLPISFVESETNFRHCGQYGHVWSAIHAFHAYIVAHNVSGLLHVPSPAHCPKKYHELSQLFTKKRMGLVVKLSRQVPLCVDSSVDSCQPFARKVFVRDLPDYHFDDSLRSYVRDLHDLRWDKKRRITFVSNEHASNGRRIKDEQALLREIRSNFSEYGWWVQSMNPANMSYEVELKMFAGSRVVVGLFGSSLHTCRFFTPGTVVVELHGGLKHDFNHAGYWSLCNSRHGLAYAGVVDPNAIPTLVEGELVYQTAEARKVGAFRARDVLDAIHYGIRGERVEMQKLYTKHMPIPFYDPRRNYDRVQVKRRYDAFVAATS